MLTKELLNILACPKCGGNLIEKENELICKNDKLAFPIIDDIPVLLIEEGTTID